jgi:squalene cyclase
MILCEAFLPAGRQLFWRKQRFPIADAHYAMGFALLARLTGEEKYYDRAVHFLNVLEHTRCPGYRHFCWGYPFDWVTRNGVMFADTPLITTTPYVYEAFACVHRIDGKARWLEVMESIAEHALHDIKDRELSADVATAGYNPDDTLYGVVNASAYRAFLLMSAAIQFSRDDYRRAAERNLNFVLQAQQPDGSWFYAMDGVRDFVDHFHTCFVLKALAKIGSVVDHVGCRQAMEAGVGYYVRNLFDDSGLPKPFSRAPRLTVYRQELYDYAECINLGALLLGRFAALDERLRTTLNDLLANWQKRDGSFRSRRLLLGWDNVPMHRWAQSQVFRSLSLLRCSMSEAGRTL